MSDSEKQTGHNDLELPDGAIKHNSEPGQDPPQGQAPIDEPDVQEETNTDVPSSEQPNDNQLDEAASGTQEEANEGERDAGIAGELNVGVATEQEEEEVENANDAEKCGQEEETGRRDEGEQTEAGILVAEAGISVTVQKDKYDSLKEADQSPRNDVVERELDITTVISVQPYTGDAAATVRFLMMPSQQVATQRCLLSQTIVELRRLFAVEMKMPEEVILVVLEGNQLASDVTLGQLGVVPNGTIQLELHSLDPVNHPLKLVRPRLEYHMPDVITVRINVDQVQYRDVVVEIERTTNRKPFLGGYRHKLSGIEYHHAAAQTVPKPRPPSNIQRFCRDTQTAQQKNIPQQTTNETSTQMTKIGAYISSEKDRLLEPRRYTTADEHLHMITRQVIIIQKYYRRWLAKRYVNVVRENEKRRREWEQEQKLKKIQEKEDRIKREFERRMNPKSKEDFDLLYHALENWRQEELARINSTLSGAERKAALCQLLDQETQLLASIGRHKLDADSENRQRFIKQFLEQTSMPKKWIGPDGKETSMDTRYTLRARQLRDIYNSINMKYVTQDERLDALLTLKHTIKEHDCKLTKEIIELVDREADLLIRGVKESNLDGLRKRISDLFLQYIKTPTFNPEAARFLKVPQDPSVLQKNIYYCAGCNQYLPSTEFQLSSNSKTIGRCRQCVKMNNNAIRRQDFSHYSYMLKDVCRTEDSFDDASKIAFLMQETDIRYLVEKIWDSQSILSACTDLYELVLVRWNRTEEWSPWNCVLLTKDEASAHEKVAQLEEEYSKDFIHRIQQKHTMAKNYFFRLPVMAERMRNKVVHSAAVASAVPPLSGKRIVQSSA